MLGARLVDGMGAKLVRGRVAMLGQGVRSKLSRSLELS